MIHVSGIVYKYREPLCHYKPEILFSCTTVLSCMINFSPVKDTVVVNDRWGTGTSCKHGGFYNCADRYSPGQVALVLVCNIHSSSVFYNHYI